MDISLVIPLYNEEDSLSPLTNWIFQSLKGEKYKFEIIFVDDGSNDNSFKLENACMNMLTGIHTHKYIPETINMSMIRSHHV